MPTNPHPSPQAKAAATRRRNAEAAKAAAAEEARVANAAAQAAAAEDRRRYAAQAKRRATVRYVLDLVERVVATFAEVAGSFLVGQVVLGHALDVTVLQAAAVSGGAAAWAIVKGLLAKWLGNRNTASALPAGADPATPPVAPPSS